MVVQHEQNKNNGMFYVQVDGETLAQMTYTKTSGEVMAIEHTMVDDELRGKNVGYQMVSNAVHFARSHDLKIDPVCPFVLSVFQKKEDYADVWNRK